MSADGWYYVSTPKMTGAVKVTDGVVSEAPPIMRRFVGQHPLRLGGWLRKQGELRVSRLAVSSVSSGAEHGQADT